MQPMKFCGAPELGLADAGIPPKLICEQIMRENDEKADLFRHYFTPS